MPLQKEKKELEAVLRDNLVTAYIDYAMEFGNVKAKKILDKASKLLNEKGRLRG